MVVVYVLASILIMFLVVFGMAGLMFKLMLFIILMILASLMGVAIISAFDRFIDHIIKLFAGGKDDD